MTTAYQCACCKDDLAFPDAQQVVYIGTCCGECARDMNRAVPLLNKFGMENLYLGKCPDNEPQQP